MRKSYNKQSSISSHKGSPWHMRFGLCVLFDFFVSVRYVFAKFVVGAVVLFLAEFKSITALPAAVMMIPTPVVRDACAVKWFWQVSGQRIC